MDRHVSQGTSDERQRKAGLIDRSLSVSVALSFSWRRPWSTPAARARTHTRTYSSRPQQNCSGTGVWAVCPDWSQQAAVRGHWIFTLQGGRPAGRYHFIWLYFDNDEVSWALILPIFLFMRLSRSIFSSLSSHTFLPFSSFLLYFLSMFRRECIYLFICVTRSLSYANFSGQPFWTHGTMACVRSYGEVERSVVWCGGVRWGGEAPYAAEMNVYPPLFLFPSLPPIPHPPLSLSLISARSACIVMRHCCTYCVASAFVVAGRC